MHTRPCCLGRGTILRSDSCTFMRLMRASARSLLGAVCGATPRYNTHALPCRQLPVQTVGLTVVCVFVSHSCTLLVHGCDNTHKLAIRAVCAHVQVAIGLLPGLRDHHGLKSRLRTQTHIHTRARIVRYPVCTLMQAADNSQPCTGHSTCTQYVYADMQVVTQVADLGA